MLKHILNSLSMLLMEHYMDLLVPFAYFISYLSF